MSKPLIHPINYKDHSPKNHRLWSNQFLLFVEGVTAVFDGFKALDIEAKYLSHGQRQWLAISMLILSDAKLLLIDEPAAGLSDSETELTAELFLELKKNHTLMVIEHDMDFVKQLNSVVTVLNEGKVMAEGSLSDIQKNEAVIEAYLGR